jgi:hypothetical protein
MNTRIALAACALALTFSAAVAQTSGVAPAASSPASSPKAGAASGKDPMAHWRVWPSNTPGWTMMSAEERKAHQEKMRSLHTRAECQTYMDEHMKLMQERAKQKNKTFKPAARHSKICEKKFKS